MGRQILIPEVRTDRRRLKSGRLKKTGRWDVSVRLPGLEGSLDARILARVMAAEAIDEIRDRWSRGVSATGEHRELHPDTPRMRRDRRYAIEEIDSRGARNPKERRFLRRYTQTRIIRDEIDGVVTRMRVQRVWLPDSERPPRPLMDSGMMYHTLHGRWRGRPRTIVVDGQRIPIEGSIRLSVAGSRAHWAYIYGGLRESLGGALERYRLPNTRKLLANAIWWRNMDRVGRGFMQTMRVMAVLSRVARLV